MAVVPIPAANCTKSQIVSPLDTGCTDFAQRHGTTFPMLLKMNRLLRNDCANLDVGHPICVSWEKGHCCLNEPALGNGTQPSGPVPNPSVGTSVGPITGSTPTSSVSAPSAPVTNGASVPSSAPTSAKSSAPAPSVSTPPKSDAASSKSSMMLAGAGVLLSIAYMF
ncbi:hypothetical protein BGX28_003593 [Mortierella sp. GBA30]|nr:hypothetical protein BGX28_003593 [Mortierella sp. GBA30]